MPDYPPGKGLDPTVWTDARAAKLDNLDAAVTSRASATDYTSTRAGYLDRLANMEAHTTPTEGTATFNTGDTYPKTVTLIDTTGTNKQHVVDGYIDLTALAAGESLEIIEYMTVKSGGSMIKYADVTYTGAQDVPLLHIVTKPAKYGLKVEAKMASAPAANRSFDYQLFKKSIA